jgi:hypothetical protein
MPEKCPARNKLYEHIYDIVPDYNAKETRRSDKRKKNKAGSRH